MIDRKIIKERLSQEKLKPLFNIEAKKGKESLNPKIQKLIKHIADRIKNGRDNNIKKGNTYYALDWAWEQASRTVSPSTIISQFGRLQEAKDTSEVENILKTWGFNIDEVLVKADPKKPGSKATLNVPMFYQVIVPLMKAYVTIRWSKIVNDRNRVPLFEYDPALSNEKSRLQTSAVTARIEVMARQFGYLNVLKQRVFHMLHYGESMFFPTEEWFTEEQETKDKEFAVKNDDGVAQKDDKGRMYRMIREGVRYDIPHPSRIFYDEVFRPSTFNTNTGACYAGYWKVVRYGDIKHNKAFWNTDAINIGDDGWWRSPNASVFFQTVYPCTMQFPTVNGQSERDRESKVLNNYYTGEMEDNAVVLTPFFERLVPSEWGLGDYDYPIWFRFLMAGDDTVIHCCPLGYSPVIWEGYDTDENRAHANSLSLECQPFQDQFSQLCSQYILSVKQNLGNVTFVDMDCLGDHGETIMEKLENLGEKLFRKRNFIRFSGMKSKRSQHGTPNAFYSHAFPQMDTNSILQAMRSLLDIMERVLVMSAQEVGSAASHEQTKYEQERIHESTGTRLKFTATSIDQANEAWKQQLYEALMYHGSDDFYVQIPHIPMLSKEVLEKLGFTYDPETHPRGDNDKKITVKVKKSAIAYLSFAERRDDLELRTNTEIAMAMLNMLQGIIQGPYGPALGPDQFLEIINLCAKMAGFPQDFRLENRMKGAPPADQQQWMMEQMMKLKDGILQEVAKGIEPIAVKLQEQDAALQKIAMVLEPLINQPLPPQQPALPSPDANAPIIIPPEAIPPGMVEPTGMPMLP